MDNQNDTPLFVQTARHKEHMAALNKSNEYYKEIAESLKADVELAKRNAEEAKKDAHLSRLFSLISLVIATISAFAAILPYLS